LANSGYPRGTALDVAGYYCRLSLRESPDFRGAKADTSGKLFPARSLAANCWRRLWYQEIVEGAPSKQPHALARRKDCPGVMKTRHWRPSVVPSVCCAVRPLFARAPKGQKAVAWRHKPQDRSQNAPSCLVSNILLSQAPNGETASRRQAAIRETASGREWLRHGVAPSELGLQKVTGAASNDGGPGAYTARLRLAAAFAARTRSPSPAPRAEHATNSSSSRPGRSPVQHRLFISPGLHSPNRQFVVPGHRPRHREIRALHLLRASLMMVKRAVNLKSPARSVIFSNRI
jgi:hypothetical protein